MIEDINTSSSSSNTDSFSSFQEISSSVNTSEGLDLASFVDILAIAEFLTFFALSYSIILSLGYLFRFFAYRIYLSMGEFSVEQDGMKAMYSNIKLWLSYVVVAITFSLLSGFSQNQIALIVFSVLYLAVFVLKLYRDLLELTEYYSYFDWSSSLAGFVRKVLGKK